MVTRKFEFDSHIDAWNFAQKEYSDAKKVLIIVGNKTRVTITYSRGIILTPEFGQKIKGGRMLK